MEAKYSKFQLRRAKTKEQLGKSSLLINIIFTLIINLSSVVATVIVLEIDDGSCDEPIRDWLIIKAILNVFLFILWILSLWRSLGEKFRKFLFDYLYLGGGIFYLGWIITGSIYEFGSDTCYDEFYYGWVLTLILLIIDYVVVTLAFCIVCFLCLTVGRVLFGISKLDDNIEQMEKILLESMNELEKAQREAKAEADSAKETDKKLA